MGRVWVAFIGAVWAAAVPAAGEGRGGVWQDPAEPAHGGFPYESSEFVEVGSVEDVLALPVDTKAVRTMGFGDRDVLALGRLEQLEALQLGGMRFDGRAFVMVSITDAMMETLAGFSSLRWLDLSQCGRVKGERFGLLAELEHLERVDLENCRVTNDGLQALSQLPSVRRLSLAFNMTFPSEGLQHVAAMEGLQWLSLSRCHQVRGVDVARLRALERLETLDLSHCNGRFLGSTVGGGIFRGDGRGVTDAGVAGLAGLERLGSLDLTGCSACTMAGLGALEGRALESLKLSGLSLQDGWWDELPAGWRCWRWSSART